MILSGNNLKAALLAGCCFVFTCEISAQQDSFYLFRRIGAQQGSYEGYPGLAHISERNNSYFVVGTTLPDLFSDWNVMYLEISKQGETEVKSFVAHDSSRNNNGWYGGPFIHNNHISGGGSYKHWNTGVDPYIYKLNRQGQPNLFQVIERDSFNYFSQGKLAHDGKFIFAGVTHEFDNDGDFYLVKTDTNANVIWERTLGTGYRDYGLSVDLAGDGGYYIFGSSDGYGNFLGTYSQSLLIKTDSAGQEQWRKHWGGLTNECAWNVVPTQDSGVVTCGCWSDDWSDNIKHAYIRKMDKVGNLEWDTIFHDSAQIQFNIFRMCRVLTNGNIIAAGDALLDGSLVPVFTMFNPDGELLHHRRYNSFLTDTANHWSERSDALFEDIRPTSDGGFIAGGTYNPGAGDTGSQDLFIVKLDSIGCEYPNCYDIDTTDTAIGIQDIAEKSQNFRAYPNPFDGSITFETNGITGSRILIYDLRGVLIETITLQKDQDTFNFDTHQLFSGIYFALLELNGLPVQSLKIVKY